MKESIALANYVVNLTYYDIPPSIVDITKKSLLDQLGVMLAASGISQECKPFVSLALAGGDKAESTIIGSGIKIPVCMAAFANGSMSHALDFDDYLLVGHPSASVIPAALAVAEYHNCTGKELITAITLGIDIFCRLAFSQSQEENPLLSGFFMPQIYGSFGATAAVCNLLKLNAPQVLDAFSLTLCQAVCSAESLYSPYSDIRAIREAFSAKNGVISALLAKNGTSGFEQPIEGKAGLFAMYSKGKFDTHIITNGLGKIFWGADVSFKPWPSCGGTHAYIEETLQLINDYHLNLSDIEEVKLTASHTSRSKEPPTITLCDPIEAKRSPTTSIAAKFSAPFVVATALVHKQVMLKHFNPESLKDAKMLEMARKIDFQLDTTLSEEERSKGLITIITKDNKINSNKIEYTRGHPRKPMGQDEFITKFKNCSSLSAKNIPDRNLDKLIDSILHMEDVNTMNEIMMYL